MKSDNFHWIHEMWIRRKQTECSSEALKISNLYSFLMLKLLSALWDLTLNEQLEEMKKTFIESNAWLRRWGKKEWTWDVKWKIWKIEKKNEKRAQQTKSRLECWIMSRWATHRSIKAKIVENWKRETVKKCFLNPVHLHSMPLQRKMTEILIFSSSFIVDA